MIGRDVIPFGILVVLFSGFLSVGNGMAFDPNAGYWILILGLLIGLLGLTNSVSNEFSE
ncbi:hypothetical protein NKF26_02935 [Haladaptatus sp. AB618]|uniref:hypothetical protein n=1 Tax=Haladaptatus sp. AB618 TaxID=2934173 RepID=UPI00209BF1F4|nr:hypothetical protein [Haladaptatus sp. AB618]MCO8252757.1 hypothetical protein [Haladaptatus sp. AB618]